MTVPFSFAVVGLKGSTCCTRNDINKWSDKLLLHNHCILFSTLEHCNMILILNKLQSKLYRKWTLLSKRKSDKKVNIFILNNTMSNISRNLVIYKEY